MAKYTLAQFSAMPVGTFLQSKDRRVVRLSNERNCAHWIHFRREGRRWEYWGWSHPVKGSWDKEDWTHRADPQPLPTPTTEAAHE